MHAWEAIQKSVDYIEEHLSGEIKIETLAEIASLSPFYFQRLFSRLVRKPVNEYIKLRRLAQSANVLHDRNTRIMDIAIDCGFSSHANFTRAFKETYSITPDEYRISQPDLNHFIKPELLLNHIMVDEDVPLITDRIVIEITRKRLTVPRIFIGIAEEVPISDLAGGKTGVSTVGKLWNEFHSQKPNIQSLLPNGNEFGVLYMGNAKEGYCTYMAGAEAEPGTSEPEYVSFELPTAEYLVCGFEAETFDELVNSAVYKANIFMDRWMKKHKLTTTDFAAEMYYTPTDEVAYLEHWMIPVPIN